jgi:hypothetical protein
MENADKNWINAMIEREATPKPARKDTVADFAKKWGISEETYYYQGRKRENRQKIVDIWLAEAVKGGNEVLQKLKENALEGKEKSIEMYLKFVLELKDKMDITSGGEKLEGTTIIVQEAQHALDELAHDTTPENT